MDEDKEVTRKLSEIMSWIEHRLYDGKTTTKDRVRLYIDCQWPSIDTPSKDRILRAVMARGSPNAALEAYKDLIIELGGKPYEKGR